MDDPFDEIMETLESLRGHEMKLDRVVGNGYLLIVNGEVGTLSDDHGTPFLFTLKGVKSVASSLGMTLTKNYRAIPKLE